MSLEILAIQESFVLDKIRLIISFIKCNISIQLTTLENLQQIDLTAKSIVLKTSDGNITQIGAIIRHLASLNKDVHLLGTETKDHAQVDKWTEFLMNEMEIPIHALVGINSSDPAFHMSFTEKLKVEQQARADITKALRIIEAHLSSRTFFASESITVADISLFATTKCLLKFELFDKTSFPSIFRWLMTVGSLSKSFGVIDFDEITNKLNSPTAFEGATAGKWSRHRTRVKELLAQGESTLGHEVVIKGWVRTSRSAEKGQLLFVELNDGSSSRSIQLVLSAVETVGYESVVNSGGVHACISIRGIVVTSPAKGQLIEISVKNAVVLGAIYGGDNNEIGGKNYPMAKKQHSLEFLREIAHLRPRSKIFSAALRIRHAMAFATHQFFNDRGFVYTHTPLITGADCEGAGEQFTVTSLLHDGTKVKDIPSDKQGNVDFTKDFFSKRTALTVSGQLNVETHACALSDVYTFGPTFRAENSHTSRHLAEFWMIEPEICFADLADDMALAEDYIRYCTAYALEHCIDDLNYFENECPSGEKGLTARLRNVVENDFAQITYTEAINILHSEIEKGKITFNVFLNWGDDLGSEHERYIAEKYFAKPTIVINYPKGIKAFYMKLNDDNETVAAMDILVPKIGELVGGSQREDRFDVLERRCRESNLKPEDMWWYLDLRKYGTVPHAGFGLGFERLIMFVTGLENIRDVISFPRVPGHADF